VLDAFLGGTTVIAAEHTGPCCYALELDPADVDTAFRRWSKPDWNSRSLLRPDRSACGVGTPQDAKRTVDWLQVFG
jgi:hypothetical protein